MEQNLSREAARIQQAMLAIADKLDARYDSDTQHELRNETFFAYDAARRSLKFEGADAEAFLRKARKHANKAERLARG